ncbi:hypothetical protein FA13DRAFT_225906 [Coprinellus micaceus]|uniref:Uncharacterized protein n=1 Tax=Coprinellus micaceus TaxID=71717 RepID=A0A4Y7TFQ6_COPMI|nr:hypothetical protein FA13DRAFT_225906 [Coprinellus micaceus]
MDTLYSSSVTFFYSKSRPHPSYLRTYLPVAFPPPYLSISPSPFHPWFGPCVPCSFTPSVSPFITPSPSSFVVQLCLSSSLFQSLLLLYPSPLSPHHPFSSTSPPLPIPPITGAPRAPRHPSALHDPTRHDHDGRLFMIMIDS